MDFQPDAVAEPVLEMLAVPGRGNEVPGRRVHVAQARPRPRRRAARLLGRRDQLVDLALPAGGSPSATVRVMSA